MISEPVLRTEIQDLIARSVSKGPKILAGGSIPEGKGAYYPPTVLVDVTNDRPVCREETFGPGTPVLSAENADHAIAMAKDGAADLSSILSACHKFRSGTIDFIAMQIRRGPRV